jgi:hypothetical protein
MPLNRQVDIGWRHFSFITFVACKSSCKSFAATSHSVLRQENGFVYHCFEATALHYLFCFSFLLFTLPTCLSKAHF